MKFISENENQNLDIAKQLLEAFPDKRIFAFFGEMGAGKTTFIKSICQYLGVKDTTSSPTFSLVNEYLDRDGKTIYHFDMYRIEDPMEAVRMGFEEYSDSGNYCFIEWPEKIHNLLPLDVVQVEISATPHHRIISIGK